MTADGTLEDSPNPADPHETNRPGTPVTADSIDPVATPLDATATGGNGSRSVVSGGSDPDRVGGGSDPDGDEQGRSGSEPSRENEQLRADNIGLLHTLTDDRPGGVVYISAHTVNAESIAARDIHGPGQRRGPVGRRGRQRLGEESGVAREVGVTASSAQEIRRLRAVTLTVGVKFQAAPLLDEERLLILRGPAGVGKRAAAIDLLQGYGPVLDVDPSVTLPELTDFTTLIHRPGRPCYVVESLAADTARSLTDYAVRSLARQLAETDSRLVITVDERIPLNAEVGAETVTWKERPEPLEALRRHLEYYLTPTTAEQVLGLLPLEDLGHQLAEREMRLINSLARQVAKAYRDGRDVADAVRDLGLEARQRIRHWFVQPRTPQQVAFLLAATVLDGCTFASVSVHAARIESILAELCRIDMEEQAQKPNRSSTALLAEVMATTAEGMLTTEFGTCATRVVRMESAALLPAVLNIVWHEYDLAAEALVRWITEAGQNADGDVRLRAALAAGQLADFDFATVRSRILLPWAKHASQVAGLSAADALGVPAGKEGTAPLALRLLHHWATVSNLDMVWTAAVAFGGYVGLERPINAMHELREIVTRHRTPVVRTVASSVTRLFGLGALAGQDVPTLVLAALTDWLRPGADPAPDVARQIAVQLLGMAGDPTDPRSSRTWNRLTHDDARPRTVTLLQDALRQKKFRENTVDVLLDLVSAADQDPDRYPALERLLKEVTSGDGAVDRDAARLRHYLTPWSQGPHPSATAVQLLDRLSLR